MLPAWRLALSTLAGKPGRTALMIGAVALAASLVVAVSCSIGSVQASLEAGIVKVLGAAHARIIHQGNGRFPGTLLDTVRSWPEVKTATGRLGAAITLVHADHRKDDAGNDLLRSTPNALGVDFKLEALFQKTELVAGRMPQTADEILLDPIAAQELKAKVGDRLEVQRFGEPVSLLVAGLYQRQRMGAMQRPAILIDRTTLEAASDRHNQLTSILIIARNPDDAAAFCERHQRELPQMLTLEPAEMIRTGLNRQVRASQFGFTVASILTFMSASFIIVTALTTSVTERQREMAVTRCIGASRGQLFASQIIAGLSMSMLGAIIGIPLGIALTAILVWWFRDMLPAGLAIQPLGIRLAVIGSAASGLIGALAPAWMASRVSPLQAMTSRARPVRRTTIIACAFAAALLVGLQLVLLLPAEAQSRFLAYIYVGMPAIHFGYFILAIPLLVLLAVPLGTLLSLGLRLPGGMLSRSLLATPIRNGFTAGALMVGMAILVCTWSSMTSLLDDWLGKIKFADGFAHCTTGIKPEQQHAIAQLPFVKSVCPIGYLPLRVIGRQIFGVKGLAPPNVTCVGFDPDMFFSVNAVEWVAGDPATAIPRLKDGTGVIVADRFLTTQQVKIGDTLTLGAGRVQHDFVIVGAVNSAGLDLATQAFGIRSQYMDFSISMVFVDFKTVEAVYDNHDVLMMQINLTSEVDDKEVIRRIAEVAPGVQFTSGRWILATINDIATALIAVQSTVAFASLFLACLGVGNVILANIHGRRYEYGVLRAVGGKRSLLVRLILGEAAILAIIGAMVGTMLGVHLGWMEARHYRDLAGLPVHLTFPILPAAAGWLVLIVMTLLAAMPGVISVIRRQPSALLAGGRNG